jgi:hypothetical protein
MWSGLVESSCEFGIEPSGPIKCWETIEYPNNWNLSSSAQFHRSLVSCYSFRTEVLCSAHGPYEAKNLTCCFVLRWILL